LREQKSSRLWATKAYRRPASSADVAELMGFYTKAAKRATSTPASRWDLARLLAAPKFIYRIEAEPANVKPGEAYPLTDLDLASRLSFFLWSTSPDDELIRVAGQGKLKDAAVLEQQVRRMLKDKKAEALAVNFRRPMVELARAVGARLHCRCCTRISTIRCRQAMRKEVELLFRQRRS
jgi:hypothetical protein